jgi:hypothetical protein
MSRYSKDVGNVWNPPLRKGNSDKAARYPWDGKPPLICRADSGRYVPSTDPTAFDPASKAVVNAHGQCSVDPNEYMLNREAVHAIASELYQARYIPVKVVDDTLNGFRRMRSEITEDLGPLVSGPNKSDMTLANQHRARAEDLKRARMLAARQTYFPYYEELDPISKRRKLTQEAEKYQNSLKESSKGIYGSHYPYFGSTAKAEPDP